MAFSDLTTDLTTDGVQASPADDSDGGWAELMELAANFPLELLSFGGSRTAGDTVQSVPVVLPKPRAVSYDLTRSTVDYDYVVDLVDGVGLSLATW